MGIRCAGCGYDNDATRVYCHSCGSKLERGSIAGQAPTGFTHPSEVVKMKGARACLPWGKYFGFFLKLGLLAALIAAIALAVLPPHDLPAPVAANEDAAQRLSGMLAEACRAETAQSLDVPSADLQSWLSGAVQLKSSGGLVAFDPRRVYVVPLRGKLRLGLELALPGNYSVFMEGEYLPARARDGYKLQAARYSIGRLPLPVSLGYPVERQLDGLRSVLAAPLAQLASASFIEIAPDQVSLRWPGTQNP